MTSREEEIVRKGVLIAAFIVVIITILTWDMAWVCDGYTVCGWVPV